MILKNFAGVLKEKITPTKTYGKEVSQHGKPHITGIIHTDENISKYKNIKDHPWHGFAADRLNPYEKKELVKI